MGRWLAIIIRECQESASRVAGAKVAGTPRAGAGLGHESTLVKTADCEIAEIFEPSASIVGNNHLELVARKILEGERAQASSQSGGAAIGGDDD